MAINFFNVSPGNGLWNILGKVFHAQGDINVSRLTTIPNDIIAIINQFNLVTQNPTIAATIQQVVTSPAGYQSAAGGTQSILQIFAQQYLTAVVNLDNPQPDNSLTTALKEVIRQMKVQGKTVKSSAVTIAAVAGGSNNGDGVCVTSTKRGDGLVQENTIAETVIGVATSTSKTASFTFLGQAAAAIQLGQDWPLGSGCNKSVGAIDANSGNSLITNGGFETFSVANIPDGWTVAVGVPGTNLKQTTVMVQTITVAGTPTAGTYTIQWTNLAGKTQEVTVPFNATASQVQTALQSMTGLSQVTDSTGATTVPNFTHTITFLGAGGAQNQFVIIDNTTGGAHSVTPATVTAGTAQVFAGTYAYEFLGDGATLSAIYQQQSNLSPDVPYAVSLWGICDASIAAGVVKVELVDGVGGSIINDDQGNANAITFNASALTTSWQHLNALQASECAFRAPAVLPPLIFMRIRLSTALTNTKNMFLDNVALTPFTELYAGGPFVQTFAGSKPFAQGDTFTLTTTNDRAGVLREYSLRNFAMDQKELLFPTAASPNIPNTSS